MKKMPKAKMPKPKMAAGGKTARGVKFGKAAGRKKSAKGGAKKMPFGATKAPGARKSQPAMKKAMGGKMGMGAPKKRTRKKK